MCQEWCTLATSSQTRQEPPPPSGRVSARTGPVAKGSSRGRTSRRRSENMQRQPTRICEPLPSRGSVPLRFEPISLRSRGHAPLSNPWHPPLLPAPGSAACHTSRTGVSLRVARLRARQAPSAHVEPSEPASHAESRNVTLMMVPRQGEAGRYARQGYLTAPNRRRRAGREETNGRAPTNRLGPKRVAAGAAPALPSCVNRPQPSTSKPAYSHNFSKRAPIP